MIAHPLRFVAVGAVLSTLNIVGVMTLATGDVGATIATLRWVVAWACLALCAAAVATIIQARRR